jgi:hypothetical protein
MLTWNGLRPKKRWLARFFEHMINNSKIIKQTQDDLSVKGKGFVYDIGIWTRDGLF